MGKKSNVQKEQPKKGGLLNKIFGGSDKPAASLSDENGVNSSVKEDGNSEAAPTSTPGVVRHNPFKEMLQRKRNKPSADTQRDAFAEKLAKRSDEL